MLLPIRLTRARFQLFVAIASMLLISSVVEAIAPPFVTDEELAKQPIIVIGRWNKTPVRAHNRVVGNVIQEMEAHTELLIERVVKGDLKPGTQKILLGAFIGWPEKEGGPVMSFMSTQMVGDVKDVADSNLWVLRPQHSWDKADPKTYLALFTYRGVQPVELEGYFRALGSKEPGAEIVKLLSAEQSVVIERALKFLAGGTLSWPYGADYIERFQGVERLRKPMTQYSGDVEKLLSRPMSETRRHATAVYAEMAGAKAVGRLRYLLHDKDAEVRAVAAGALIHCDDRDSGEDIVRAVVGRADASVVCQLIERLRVWKSPQAIPALIEFLQHDDVSGNDMGIPALQVQNALKERTGHDFPTDVSASRSAWRKAELIADAKERAAILARVLPYDPKPLVGKLTFDPKNEALVLTNRSKNPVVVSREPTCVDYTCSFGVSAKYGEVPAKQSDFVTIAPGATLRLNLDSGWAQKSALERLTVSYLRNGNEFGVNAWIGVIDLNFKMK
jgi:hypothetical protein